MNENRVRINMKLRPNSLPLNQHLLARISRNTVFWRILVSSVSMKVVYIVGRYFFYKNLGCKWDQIHVLQIYFFKYRKMTAPAT